MTMALKNPQYNAIIRRYDQLQLENNRRLEERTKEIYKAIPEYARLDEEIAHTAAEYARQAVLHPGKNPKKDFKAAMKLFDDQKAALLSSHGYPADYVQPQYHCPDCQDTGYIGNQKCHCFKQAIVDLVYSQSNIRERLETENFKNFRLDYYSAEKDRRLGISPRENMENILAQCQEFITHFDESHDNILFYGSTGVGKTYLSNCIARELLDRAHTVIYLTAFQLVDILENSTFGSDDENDIPENMFNYVLDCDLLIIDDLGTEMNNSFITSRLFLCINERLLRQRSTVISTNLSLDELQKEYSERIFSRMISHYKILPVLGDDIRVKKAISG